MPGPFLCQRKPATTQSAVRWCLILSIARLPGWYGAVEPLGDDAVEAGALEPVEPVGRQSRGRASPASGGPAASRWPSASPAARAARPGDVRGGPRRRARAGPRRRTTPATRSASIFTRDAAGWIRSRSASKSSAPSRAITTSPSSDAALGQRGAQRVGELGEVAVERLEVAATACRSRRRRGRPARGSRPTSARRASHRPRGGASDGLREHRLDGAGSKGKAIPESVGQPVSGRSPARPARAPGRGSRRTGSGARGLTRAQPGERAGACARRPRRGRAGGGSAATMAGMASSGSTPR